MKYKEFNDWCNERACDGRWGLREAMACVDICHLFSYIPKWKREEAWQHFQSRDVLELIVTETNKIIEKTKQDTAFQGLVPKEARNVTSTSSQMAGLQAE